jgi:tRNA threonylcarbamoyl adenosine modification protein (Sua5/YciO/YrdC/YwlC family)
MEILRINAEKPEPNLISQAARIARAGVPIALPTDTVYGVGVPVAPGCTPRLLYELKGRDADKAIPLLVSGIEALETYGHTVPAYAYELAAAHWPGALTLIVRASEAVPEEFRASDGSVALRAPACPIALALLEELAAPLATSSANLQGGEPATSLATLDRRLVSHLALTIDGGATPGNIPSTIISCLTDTPILIRAGALKKGIS